MLIFTKRHLLFWFVFLWIRFNPGFPWTNRNVKYAPWKLCKCNSIFLVCSRRIFPNLFWYRVCVSINHLTPEIRLFVSLKDIAPKWRGQVWCTCLYYFTGAASQSGATCAPKQPDAPDQSGTNTQKKRVKIEWLRCTTRTCAWRLWTSQWAELSDTRRTTLPYCSLTTGLPHFLSRNVQCLYLKGAFCLSEHISYGPAPIGGISNWSWTLCHRFSKPSIISQLPSWISRHLRVADKYETMLFGCHTRKKHIL